MATDDIGSHDSIKRLVALLPFPVILLTTAHLSCQLAVCHLWAWVSRISLVPQVLAGFFKMFSRKSSDPQDFSQGFNPHSCEPTSLKNHGFPQGFNHLLENAVNSPQVVKNICAQAWVEVNLQRSEVRYKEVEVEVKAKLYLPIQNQDFWVRSKGVEVEVGPFVPLPLPLVNLIRTAQQGFSRLWEQEFDENPCTAVSTSPRLHPGICQCHWLIDSHTSGDSDDDKNT
ncbi:hypothetical protein B0H13DRAFT_1892695 [Mycena leptocephala]|nr:hypothetical protein B0H13DRAFT_1892695 [Mycena leptocephala]